MKWRDRKDFGHPQGTGLESAGPDAFDKSPANKRSHRVSCAESANESFHVSAVAPGQRRRVRRSFLWQRANAVPPVIWRCEFPACAICSDAIVSRAHQYLTSGLPKIQTFRKIRLRQSNHSRIQQHITAPNE